MKCFDNRVVSKIQTFNLLYQRSSGDVNNESCPSPFLCDIASKVVCSRLWQQLHCPHVSAAEVPAVETQLCCCVFAGRAGWKTVPWEKPG